MIKLYFYYVTYEQVSDYGERRYEKGKDSINKDWNPTSGNYKLADFGYDEEDLKEAINNNAKFKNGDGYEVSLHRITNFYESEESFLKDEECRHKFDEIIDTMLICKDLPYFYLRRYLDEDGDTIAEVKTESKEAPEEDEARKEAGVESDAFRVVVVKTYEGADKDEEEQVGSDFYPIDKKKKREEIISELRKVADQLSKTRYDLDDLSDEADEVDEELGKKLTRAYLTAEELLKSLDDID